MKDEILLATEFLVKYIISRDNIKLEEKVEDKKILLNELTGIHYLQMRKFRFALVDNLMEHFEGHWYPDEPQRGKAYRRIFIDASNHVLSDNRIAKAATKSQLELQLSIAFYRQKLTIWINPGEVKVDVVKDGVEFTVVVKGLHCQCEYHAKHNQ